MKIEKVDVDALLEQTKNLHESRNSSILCRVELDVFLEEDEKKIANDEIKC